MVEANSGIPTTRACRRVPRNDLSQPVHTSARSAGIRELVKHLRSQRRIRRSRHASIHGHSQGKIVDAISIRERPAEVEDRAIPGHWEGDLHPRSAQQRSRGHAGGTSFALLHADQGVRQGHRYRQVAALSQHVSTTPGDVAPVADLDDRGLEMAQHKSFTIATDMKVCTSAIRRVPGNAARTEKYQWAVAAHTCQRTTQIYLSSLNRSWMQSPSGSIPRPRQTLGFPELRRINSKPVLQPTP